MVANMVVYNTTTWQISTTKLYSKCVCTRNIGTMTTPTSTTSTPNIIIDWVVIRFACSLRVVVVGMTSEAKMSRVR